MRKLGGCAGRLLRANEPRYKALRLAEREVTDRTAIARSWRAR